jgi:hypothetical protein
MNSSITPACGIVGPPFRGLFRDDKSARKNLLLKNSCNPLISLDPDERIQGNPSFYNPQNLGFSQRNGTFQENPNRVNERRRVRRREGAKPAHPNAQRSRENAIPLNGHCRRCRSASPHSASAATNGGRDGATQVTMARAKPSQPLAPTVWIAVPLRRGSLAMISNMRRTPTTSGLLLAASTT